MFAAHVEARGVQVCSDMNNSAELQGIDIHNNAVFVGELFTV
jgi:hypothetical protein